MGSDKATTFSGDTASASLLAISIVMPHPLLRERRAILVASLRGVIKETEYRRDDTAAPQISASLLTSLPSMALYSHKHRWEATNDENVIASSKSCCFVRIARHANRRSDYARLFADRAAGGCRGETGGCAGPGIRLADGLSPLDRRSLCLDGRLMGAATVPPCTLGCAPMGAYEPRLLHGAWSLDPVVAHGLRDQPGVLDEARTPAILA